MSSTTERICNIQDELQYLTTKVDKDIRYIKELLRKIYDYLNTNTENYTN